MNDNINSLKDYFDHILDAVNPEIYLDEDQREAIVADDDAALIIAGAGTGKTTTMIAKVKYLVDIKGVDPSKILVMSFARKNVEELRDRINVDLNIPADISTFHSLGYRYMKALYANSNRRCYVVDNNEKEKIFADFFRNKIYTSTENMKDFIETFDPKSVGTTWLFGKILKNNYERFNSFDDYFNYYKSVQLESWGDVETVIKQKAEERANADSPKTLRGEFVRSKGEAMIANYLFENGIDYEYERVYEEIMPDYSTYRPDFTVTIGGEKVYIEYFGLSAEGAIYDKTYERIRKIKEAYHRNHHTRFIALDYDPKYNYLNILGQKLREMGFVFHPKTPTEIAHAILDENPLAEVFKVKRLFVSTIDIIKSSPDRTSFDKIVKDYLSTNPPIQDQAFDKDLAYRQFKYIRSYLDYYNNRLREDPTLIGFDYSDMIFYAKKYIESLSAEHFNYEYVLIDEYQDISFDRYELTIKTMARNHAKLTAIGDDWQSIYAFTGSKIEYTYNFQKLFPNAKLYRIEHTYRTVQNLADITGDFIMKNKSQIPKSLISDRNLNSPIKIVYFEGKTKSEQKLAEAKALEKEIIKMHQADPTGSILVLARINSTISALYDNDETGFINELNTKASIEGQEDFLFDIMTIHKSKGLTADHVFLIGLNKSFPREVNNEYWLKTLFMHKPEPEGIDFAEERRVFYVAMTRTKNQVILLCNRDSNERSSFLNEIMNMMAENEKQLYI